MQKIDAFITDLQTYYGGYKNKQVAKDIQEELEYYDPKYFDAILRQIKSMVPAAYLADRKSVTDAIKVLKIERLDEPNHENLCPSCNKKMYITGGICPWCGYDMFGSDSPKEWREFVELAKAGKKPVLDFEGMLRGLQKNENKERFDSVLTSAKRGVMA